MLTEAVGGRIDHATEFVGADPIRDGGAIF